jgi:alkaline phosphatase D
MYKSKNNNKLNVDYSLLRSNTYHDDSKPKARQSSVWCSCGCVASIIAISFTIIVLIVLIAYPWLYMECQHILKPVDEDISFMPDTIAFGSCQSNWMPHSIINKINSNVFIYLGDNIYGDDGVELISWFPKHWLWYRNVLYNKLSCRHSFQKLVSRTKYVLSMWDDHDYGADNEGKDNPIRRESQAKFLDFWRIPKYSKRRRDVGIYGSYRFNASGSSVLIILPDVRSFSDLPQRENAKLLGESQWIWLEDTIRSKKSDIIIVATGTQFVDQSVSSDASIWSNFPDEKRRLESLLNPANTIFISGDVHRAGIMRSHSGFLDITSSPLSYNGNGPDGTNGIQASGNNNYMYMDNYGLLDLKRGIASVNGIDGSVLDVKI